MDSAPEPKTHLVGARLDAEELWGTTVASDRGAAEYPWPQPFKVLDDPKLARALIPLPDFDAELHELAAHIATFALPANKEYSRMWQRHYAAAATELGGSARSAGSRGFARVEDVEEALRVLPRFEVVFRIAAGYAGYPGIKENDHYDALLILAAWFSVKREQHPHGFLSVYPKALLCPLPHNLPASRLADLSPTERRQFSRRAPVYLRYLLLHLAGLRSCEDLENGVHRAALKSHGFKLVPAEEVPAFIFPGITRGEDPPVRPWLLGRTGMFEGAKGRQRLIEAAVWVARYKEKVVTRQEDAPLWNLERVRDIDWDASFKAEGVGGAKSWARFPEIRNWRGLLKALMGRVGYGTLMPELIEEFLSGRGAVSLDSDAELWKRLDACTRRVVDHLRDSHPELFSQDCAQDLNIKEARDFRHWPALYDLESTNILSEYGVSAFHALSHVYPQWFGWGPGQLKPWEVEKENARWRGKRGRLLFRSAYAIALCEAGLGKVEAAAGGFFWTCSSAEFDAWYQEHVLFVGRAPSEALYEIGRRGRLTPLLNGELNPSEGVSVLAGKSIHQKTPAWDQHRWAHCMNLVLREGGGLLRVRLDLPALPPLPLDVREALLAQVGMRYAHPHIAFVRPLDIQLVHDAHFARLEDIPGWFDDLRLLGTPLEALMNQESSELRLLIERIADGVWNWRLEGKPRFSTLSKLLGREGGHAAWQDEIMLALTDDEFRMLCRIARDKVLDTTNVVPATKESARRALTRLANRQEAGALVQCAIAYVDSHRALSSESELCRFTSLDIIDDLLALTVKSCAQHVIERRGAEESGS